MILVLSTACSAKDEGVEIPAPTETAVFFRNLSAVGVGEVYRYPGVACVYIGVHVDANDVTTTLSLNNTSSQAVAQAVQDIGVEAKDVQTTNSNVYPTQDYAPDGTVSQDYFVVENSISITERDLPKLGQLLDAVIRSGATTINGITFDVQDKESACAEARDLAIKNVIAEAGAIAAASGVTLGDLQSVNVYSNEAPVTFYDSSSGTVSAGQLVFTINANLYYDFTANYHRQIVSIL
ncbi:MAG: SIMPL domain-containing protein [Chloroflexi bacterium]|nr:SIMPL domain-containing protein [Chloroflexota bacterium]